jgi:hypothetical protein
MIIPVGLTITKTRSISLPGILKQLDKVDTLKVRGNR